jgi:hypothetical protein
MDGWDETACLPRVLATGVGSLPHKNAAEGVDLILASFNDAPHAPQFPRADPREQMWIQFSEGLPRFEVNVDTLKYRFDTSGDTSSDLEAFYSGYMEAVEGGALDRFAIGPDYGSGIHLFLEKMRLGKRRPRFVKVQVTGPISFATAVTDEHGKPIFYHPHFRDVAVKGMGLKAMWLVETFKPYADNVIVFFDEPSLSAYGSSVFLGVSEEDVVESLDEVISMVLQRGGIPGVHCCGNTDWSLLMKTTARIINFDAVDYMDSMGIYPREVSDFLERGGVLAWGAVSNNDGIRNESPETVRDRVIRGIELLEAAGVDGDLLREKAIVTPACGCGGLGLKSVALVYEVLAGVESMGDSLLNGRQA